MGTESVMVLVGFYAAIGIVVASAFATFIDIGRIQHDTVALFVAAVLVGVFWPITVLYTLGNVLGVRFIRWIKS